MPSTTASASSSSISSSTSTTIDSTNPLYLHPSDHPGMVLVSKIFDGSGFGAWKRAMSIALSAKNKYTFVTGEQIRPTDPIQLSQWIRCNDMVISWILNTLSRDISESVLYAENANKIWKELSDRFGQASGAKLYQLQKNLCELSQGTNDIATYFTKMKAIWDELNSLNTVPVCSCGASALLVKQEQNQRLIQFLMGLNPSYDNVRGSILMMKPLPSISEAYALLVQDEKQREMHSSTPFGSESTSMNVNTQQSYGRFDNRKSVVCSNCKKSGHSVNKCYRLVGFPKDFKFTKTKRFSANVDIIDQPSTESAGSSPLVPGLTSEQFTALLQLLQKNTVDKAEPNPTTI